MIFKFALDRAVSYFDNKLLIWGALVSICGPDGELVYFNNNLLICGVLVINCGLDGKLVILITYY
jgi:hypothetical protein